MCRLAATPEWRNAARRERCVQRQAHRARPRKKEINIAPDPDMFQRGYRAGDKATVDLPEDESETLLRAFKAGFVHRHGKFESGLHG
jgi:hypothetical protein